MSAKQSAAPIFLIISLIGIIVSIRNLEILQGLDTVIIFEGFYFTQLLTVLLIFAVLGYLVAGVVSGSLTRGEALAILSDTKSALSADKKTQSNKIERSSDSELLVAATTEEFEFDLGNPVKIRGFGSFDFRQISAKIVWNRIAALIGVIIAIAGIIYFGGVLQ